MRVLLIGSGGREHALAWALSASPLLDKLFAAPGNAGICDIAECVPLDPADHRGGRRLLPARVDRPGRRRAGSAARRRAGRRSRSGRHSRLRAVASAAAQLEGSKGFTKDLCREAGIPTAAYARFFAAEAARAYVTTHRLPIVVKEDGLAAGKGVTSPRISDAALAALDAIFARPGASRRDRRVPRGRGGELLRADGRRTVIPFGTAQDHKRAFDGDRRARTPAGWAPTRRRRCSRRSCRAHVMAEIVRPTVAALARRGIRYRGVLYRRADDRRRRAEAHRIQRPLRRSGMPGADDAAEGRPPDASSRPRSTACSTRSACAGATRRRSASSWRRTAIRVPIETRLGDPGRRRRRRPSPASRSFTPARRRRQAPRSPQAGGCSVSPPADGTIGFRSAVARLSAVDRIDWPQGFCRRDIGWRALASRSQRGGRQINRRYRSFGYNPPCDGENASPNSSREEGAMSVESRIGLALGGGGARGMAAHPRLRSSSTSSASSRR